MSLNINDFEYIVKIAEEGSLRKASEKLFISQSALSQRVKYIESAYNALFIKRNQQGAELTDSGEIFVKYAKELLKLENEMRLALINAQGSIKNTISFGVSHVYVDAVYQTILPPMHEAFPEMQFFVIERSSPVLLEQLASGEVDIALCFLSDPKRLPELSYQIIRNDSFVFLPASGSALQKKLAIQHQPAERIDPQLLDNEAVATCIPGRFLHHYLDAIIKEENICPQIKYTGESLHLLYSFVERGFASAVFYESFLLKKGIRQYYHLDSSVNDRMNLVLAWKKNSAMQDYFRRFVKIIRKVNDQE